MAIKYPNIRISIKKKYGLLVSLSLSNAILNCWYFAGSIGIDSWINIIKRRQIRLKRMNIFLLALSFGIKENAFER